MKAIPYRTKFCVALLAILVWLLIATTLLRLVPVTVSQAALKRGENPLWWWALVSGAALALGPSLLIAAIAVPLVRQSLRAKRGRCIACGYDLRGDLALGCPECGWRRETAS
ncbi:MAG: hypothetical protein IH830_10080 [Planctomycetes bacterium]|nr:hypothetical protein [Planctomycetota bacterium]